MRSDMFKVIVERPRWGASHASSPKLKRTKDRTLKHIGHKRHAFENAPYTKSLNENLAPLVRFLRQRPKFDHVVRRLLNFTLLMRGSYLCQRA